jgi:hypothetical protein
MASKKAFTYFFFILLTVKILLSLILFSISCLWAGSVVEDSQTRFIFADEVNDASVDVCDDGGVRLVPEKSVYVHNSRLPYREYRVAIPANVKPAVTVKDVSTQTLTLDWCSEDTLVSKGVMVSAPLLKDGLWVVDIRVPTVSQSGAHWVLRKNFELTVKFSGSSQGKNPESECSPLC